MTGLSLCHCRHGPPVTPTPFASEGGMETLGSGKRKLGVDDNPGLPERLRGEDEEEEEREIQELEREVGEMARRVLDARKINLDRVLQGLSSELVAKRPPLPPRTLAVFDAGETGDFSYGFPVSLKSHIFFFIFQSDSHACL